MGIYNSINEAFERKYGLKDIKPTKKLNEAKEKEKKFVQVRLTGKDKEGYNYCGNGGRSWVKIDSSNIDTWPTREAAIEEGNKNYKKTFKYGKNWDVVELNSELIKQVDESCKINRSLTEVKSSKGTSIMSILLKNKKDIWGAMADSWQSARDKVISLLDSPELEGNAKVAEAKEVFKNVRSESKFASLLTTYMTGMSITKNESLNKPLGTLESFDKLLESKGFKPSYNASGVPAFYVKYLDNDIYAIAWLNRAKRPSTDRLSIQIKDNRLGIISHGKSLLNDPDKAWSECIDNLDQNLLSYRKDIDLSSIISQLNEDMNISKASKKELGKNRKAALRTSVVKSKKGLKESLGDEERDDIGEIIEEACDSFEVSHKGLKVMVDQNGQAGMYSTMFYIYDKNGKLLNSSDNISDKDIKSKENPVDYLVSVLNALIFDSKNESYKRSRKLKEAKEDYIIQVRNLGNVNSHNYLMSLLDNYTDEEEILTEYAEIKNQFPKNVIKWAFFDYRDDVGSYFDESGLCALTSDGDILIYEVTGNNDQIAIVGVDSGIFKTEDMDIIMKEARKLLKFDLNESRKLKEVRKKDLWDTIYGELTDDGEQVKNPKTGKPMINLGAGYNYLDQVTTDKAGNIVVRGKEERDFKPAIDIADKYAKEGVTYNIAKGDYGKGYTYGMTIEIPMNEKLDEAVEDIDIEIEEMEDELDPKYIQEPYVGSQLSRLIYGHGKEENKPKYLRHFLKDKRFYVTPIDTQYSYDGSTEDDYYISARDDVEIFIKEADKYLNESVDTLGKDVEKYQDWVDYDMKRYHKITKKELDKAGLEVIKDQYGDYEVTAKSKKNLDEAKFDYSQYQQQWDDLQEPAAREMEEVRAKFYELKEELITDYQEFIDKYMKYHKSEPGEGLWWNIIHAWGSHGHAIDISDAPENILERLRSYEFDDKHPIYINSSDEIKKVYGTDDLYYLEDNGRRVIKDFNLYIEKYPDDTSSYDFLRKSHLKSIAELLGSDLNNYLKIVDNLMSKFRELADHAKRSLTPYTTVFNKNREMYAIFGKYLNQASIDILNLLKQNGYKGSIGNFTYRKGKGPKGIPSFSFKVKKISEDDIQIIKNLIEDESDTKVYNVSKAKANLNDNDEVTFDVIFNIWMPGLKNAGREPGDEFREGLKKNK